LWYFNGDSIFLFVAVMGMVVVMMMMMKMTTIIRH